MPNVGIRDFEREISIGRFGRLERSDLSGQVLFCTVGLELVQLDVVADEGRLPAGTPFIVTAELPGGFLGALVETVVDRWNHGRDQVIARVSRVCGHNRVDLLTKTTRVVLDVASIAVPTPRAA